MTESELLKQFDEPDVSVEQEPAAVESEEKPDKGESKSVPLAALEAERTKRQQLEASLRETQTKLDELSTLKDELKTWKDTQPEKPTVDYWDQPKGYIDNLADQSTKGIDLVKQRQDQLEQQLLYQQQVNQVRMTIDAQQSNYRSEHPDYDEAYRFVQNVQANNLKLAGLPDDQVSQALAGNELQLAATLMASGKDYADYVYQMAGNMGYKAGTPTKENKKLSKIEKGTKKNPDASQGKLGELQNMPEDEFEAAMSEVFGFLKK